jgi:hypothetical protein
MRLKTAIAPLTLAVLAFVLVSTQPGISCVAALVMKIATKISL